MNSDAQRVGGLVSALPVMALLLEDEGRMVLPPARHMDQGMSSRFAVPDEVLDCGLELLSI